MINKRFPFVKKIPTVLKFWIFYSQSLMSCLCTEILWQMALICLFVRIFTHILFLSPVVFLSDDALCKQ